MKPDTATGRQVSAPVIEQSLQQAIAHHRSDGRLEITGRYSHSLEKDKPIDGHLVLWQAGVIGGDSA